MTITERLREIKETRRLTLGELLDIHIWRWEFDSGCGTPDSIEQRELIYHLAYAVDLQIDGWETESQS